MKFYVVPLCMLLVSVKLAHSRSISVLGQVSIFGDSESQLRLVKYGEDTPPRWMTEEDKLALLRAGVRFMDVTDYQEYKVSMETNLWQPILPTEAKFHDEVQPYIGELSTEPMQLALKEFTSFQTRYYKSSWGADSARWLISQIRELASGQDHVVVQEFAHRWDQFSIIARIEGQNETVKDEIVIVGAHQDSVNMWLPSFGRSPGADDDGSGTVSILEAFRVLVSNGFRPERTVEFHWYSGEEGGLLGSQAVSTQYHKEGKRVVSMLQCDMTGYVGSNGEVIGIVTDHVDDKLTNFLKVLTKTYASIPFVLTECGYACSDHASWRDMGYPSAFTIESAFGDSNHFIHTSSDTMEKLSLDHMKEFSKIAVGFAVELSHPSN